MKKLLLFTVSLFTGLTYGQQPINNYFSAPLSEFAIVSNTIDHSTSGANAVWSFGTLTLAGTNNDSFAAPSATELTSYPGTTLVLTISGAASSQVFHKVTGSDLSLTGASNPEFTLNYNTDNALIGTYPLTYGNAAINDNIAGDITAEGLNTSYTGTINTEVDAHGTISFSVTGQGAYSGNVTRVISQQSIAFNFFGIAPGTATMTTINYYKNADGALVFRSTSGAINVSAPFNVNETFSSNEALITNTLSVADATIAANSIQLYPNPVQETLYIKDVNNVQISTIQIIDISGRAVLTIKGNQNTINLSILQSGLYLVQLNTSEGVITRKILKN